MDELGGLLTSSSRVTISARLFRDRVHTVAAAAAVARGLRDVADPGRVPDARFGPEVWAGRERGDVTHPTSQPANRARGQTHSFAISTCLDVECSE